LPKKSKVQTEPFILLLLTMILTTFLILPQGMLPSSASPENICEIQTTNLANQTVAGVLVEVYNATSGLYLNLGNETDETGRVKFMLEAGNYTFKAFWKNVTVGAVYNQSVTENVALQLNCTRLSNLKLAVTNETGAPIPLIDLNLRYNYTTRENDIVPETGSFTTNVNGTVQLQNVFTNISYLIEARRYGFLFNTTVTPLLPEQDWNNITIIAPTYTMFVQALDSKDDSIEGLEVAAYEWSSGIGESFWSNRTDSNGNVTLSLTFGKYRLRLYKNDVFLEEVTVDLLNQSLNQYFFVVHIDVYNVNLNVRVIDYFGQPIPNVLVVFQRKVDSNYETVENKTTASDGVAQFNGIIGGDSRVYVSVAGRPGETQYLYLVYSKQILFKLDGYVAVAGYTLETSQFVTMVILLILIVACIIASTYKRLQRLFQRRRK